MSCHWCTYPTASSTLLYVFLIAKKSPAKIHRELTSVYGTNTMSIQHIWKQIHDFSNVHDKEHDLHPVGIQVQLEQATRSPAFILFSKKIFITLFDSSSTACVLNRVVTKFLKGDPQNCHRRSQVPKSVCVVCTETIDRSTQKQTVWMQHQNFCLGAKKRVNPCKCWANIH